MRPARNYLRLLRYKLVPREVLALRLPLFRRALELSQLSRHEWCPRLDLHQHGLSATAFSTLRVCFFTTRACWYPPSDSNREHPRFECGASAIAPGGHRKLVRAQGFEP